MSTIKLQPYIPTKNQIDPKSVDQRQVFERKMQGAARLYERQFLQEMVNAMRKTVQHSPLSEPSMAEKIYLDKMFDKYVDQWSDSGGVGFADVIYQQLLQRYSPYHKQNLEAPKGPLPTNENHQFKILAPQEERVEPLGAEARMKNENSPLPVTSPWSGQVTFVHTDEQDRHWVKIKHDNGVFSELRFKGDLSEKLTPGISMNGGESLGEWLGRGESLTWFVHKA